jgi:hypothetical protein
MENESHNLRSVKYKLDEIFDAGKLKDKGILKKEIFFREYEPFYNNLANEVKSLTGDELNSLVNELEYKIEQAKTRGKLSSTGLIYLQYRKQLRTELFKIYVARSNENTHNPSIKTGADPISSPVKPLIKPFADYLIHNDKNALAVKLKDEFKTEKGKAIHLLLLALQDNNLITIESREGKNIYTALQAFFDREIGSYQSVHDFKYSEFKHKGDLISVSKRLTKILSGLSNPS